MVADALVRPAGKGEVAVGCARDIKTIGLRKLFRITVGAANAHVNPRTRRHRHAAHHGVASGPAVAQLVGALVTQHLLHRALDQRGVGDQARFFIRPLRQRHQAVADQVGSGLMPRIKNENAILQ